MGNIKKNPSDTIDCVGHLGEKCVTENLQHTSFDPLVRGSRLLRLRLKKWRMRL